MKNSTKRTKGAVKELGGKAERKLGRVFGSSRMAARGRLREIEGREEKESAKTHERAKGAIEEAAGSVQRGAGRVLDDEQMEARGTLRRAKAESDNAQIGKERTRNDGE